MLDNAPANLEIGQYLQGVDRAGDRLAGQMD
jgi:hypothetical protein